MQNKTTGVILLNMGGPDRLEDVRPFLYNIFSDREIIRLGPALLQKPIAWYIARKRAPKSMDIYRQIGGGSPIAEITRQQQEALEKALSADGDFVVATAMRYWKPTTASALELMYSSGVETVVALSLYPHFSCATSGSSLKELKRHLDHPEAPRIIEISSWPTQPDYISCLAAKINAGLEAITGENGTEDIEILYSAHSLPVSFIEEGDPYVEHLRQTIAAVENITGKRGRLCYQSRSGPVEWLSPSTPEMIENVAYDGCRSILMVPISFVSDHVETLYEINIQYRELAAKRGIHLRATESLNTDPQFIEGLRQLVLQSLERS
jgi:ferrochelatase